MKFHIENAPNVVLEWFDACILAKTPVKFIKTAATFAILTFKDKIEEVITQYAQSVADTEGYIDIDTLCDNLTKSIEIVGDSVDIPMGMFIDNPLFQKLTITVTKQDIQTLKELMTEKGVK